MGRQSLQDPKVLGLFVDLVGQYDRLCTAFPVSVGALELFDLPIPDFERWHRIVRTLAMRKFLIGQREVLRVDRVVEAYRRCLFEEDPAVDRFADDFLRITNERTESLEVFEDILYGDLLHGEYERRQRNIARPQVEKDIAVWEIGEAAEMLVRALRASIMTAASEGRLSDDATTAVAEFKPT